MGCQTLVVFASGLANVGFISVALSLFVVCLFVCLSFTIGIEIHYVFMFLLHDC